MIALDSRGRREATHSPFPLAVVIVFAFRCRVAHLLLAQRLLREPVRIQTRGGAR